jgi:hypothetical protein
MTIANDCFCITCGYTILTEELAARSGCVLSMIIRGCWVVPVLNEAFQCGHSVNQRPITSTIFLWG